MGHVFKEATEGKLEFVGCISYGTESACWFVLHVSKERQVIWESEQARSFVEKCPERSLVLARWLHQGLIPATELRFFHHPQSKENKYGQ